MPFLCLGAFVRMKKQAGAIRTPTCDMSGAPGPIRTADTRFRRAVLYPLSYEGMVDILPPAPSSDKAYLLLRRASLAAWRASCAARSCSKSSTSFFSERVPTRACACLRNGRRFTKSKMMAPMMQP